MKTGSQEEPAETDDRRLGRQAFVKISEVEGIRLSKEAEQAFAEFDAQGLSHEERRRAIIGRFKRPAG
jgi:hypothetical protein